MLLEEGIGIGITSYKYYHSTEYSGQGNKENSTLRKPHDLQFPSLKGLEHINIRILKPSISTYPLIFVATWLMAPNIRSSFIGISVSVRLTVDKAQYLRQLGYFQPQGSADDDNTNEAVRR